MTALLLFIFGSREQAAWNGTMRGAAKRYASRIKLEAAFHQFAARASTLTNPDINRGFGS